MQLHQSSFHPEGAGGDGWGFPGSYSDQRLAAYLFIYLFNAQDAFNLPVQQRIHEIHRQGSGVAAIMNLYDQQDHATKVLACRMVDGGSQKLRAS